MRETVLKATGLRQSTAVIVGSTATFPHHWCTLARGLAKTHDVQVPHLWNVRAEPRWQGGEHFSLMDDAALLEAQVDQAQGPVHLIGHSYGGAVALRFALAQPEQVASLTLFEPALFGVLRYTQDNGRSLFKDVYDVAKMATTAATNDHNKVDVRHVVDFWHGPGAWARMAAEDKDGLYQSLPKMALEFLATLWDDAPVRELAGLDIPTIIFRGSDTSLPMHRMASWLARTLPRATLCTIAGAGHMLPVTHGHQMVPLVANHLRKKRFVPAQAA